MADKYTYDFLSDVRYLIMYSTMNDFDCMEIELASGFFEEDFSRISSLFYRTANINNEININNILDFIKIEDIFIARSCIIHSQSSFGIYSRKSCASSNILEKYENSLNILNRIIKNSGNDV